MEWISVEDRLPKDKGKWYLICSDVNMPHEKTVTMSFLDSVVDGEETRGLFWLTHNDKYRNQYNDEWEKVTHWMPLPEPPKEK